MKVYAQEGEFELDPELVRSLAATYPAVNVRRELERMYLWTLKNPSARWVNPLRGIEAWLKRASRKALEARGKKPDVSVAKAAYLNGTAPKAISTAWWATDQGTEDYGRKRGISAKPGESMAQYRARLRAA